MRPDRIIVGEVRGLTRYGGMFRVNGVESLAIMLWMDSAPPEVQVECIEVSEGAEARISNRWRLENGREDEWFNNYGILIDELGDNTFVLRCSDGVGDELSFEDLLVQVRHVRA